ncbi:site-2 protease family protein [Patescibacteria group bacterium]|nr:site-2 protease family protein [Patescibacteria group bacterium]
MIIFLTIFFLAILILGHEFGHFIVAKMLKIKVEEFGIGFPPRLFARKFRETEYSLNLLPFGGFVRIYGEDALNTKEVKDKKRSFYYQSFIKKALVISAGVIINILIAWIAFSVVLSVGMPGGIFINDVVEGSPAYLAGFEAGEFIEGFESADEFLSYIDAHLGEEIVINDKAVTPRIDTPEGEGPLGIGILPSGIDPTPFPQNIWLGLKTALRTLGLIFIALGSMLFGALSGNFEALSQVSGPVGVFNIVKDAGQLGSIYFVQLVGIISLNLAALNTIPFPALDGGRLLFIALQKIFGDKILNKRTEIIINVAGFLFLIALMIAVTIKDIISL